MLKACAEIRNIALVSCFGTKPDSVLLWSHYANKHKGVCLEFEVDDDNFKTVSYVEKQPIFRLSDTLKILFGHEFIGEKVDAEKPEYQYLLNPILAKSKKWEYEHEIRYVYSKNKHNPDIYDGLDKYGNPIKLLKMPKIIKIYVGCQAKAEFISKIRKIAGTIPVVKMKIAFGEYRLEEDNL